MPTGGDLLETSVVSDHGVLDEEVENALEMIIEVPPPVAGAGNLYSGLPYDLSGALEVELIPSEGDPCFILSGSESFPMRPSRVKVVGTGGHGEPDHQG